MINIPEQYLHIGTLVAHGLLIPTGLVVLIVGHLVNAKYESRLDPDETVMTEVFELSIIVGVVDIVIGICGLCAALMKQKYVHMANAALLALSLILNIGFLIACIYLMNKGEDREGAITKKKELFLYSYGMLMDPEKKEFTEMTNGYHKVYSCCGWTGLDGENVYLKSEWHKLANRDDHAKQKTLPESCCVLPDDMECQTTLNVKEAREKGLVYKKDCLDMAFANKASPYGGYLFQLVLSMVTQIPCTFFTVMLLLPILGLGGNA